MQLEKRISSSNVHSLLARFPPPSPATSFAQPNVTLVLRALTYHLSVSQSSAFAAASIDMLSRFWLVHPRLNSVQPPYSSLAIRTEVSLESSLGFQNGSLLSSYDANITVLLRMGASLIYYPYATEAGVKTSTASCVATPIRQGSTRLATVTADLQPALFGVRLIIYVSLDILCTAFSTAILQREDTNNICKYHVS